MFVWVFLTVFNRRADNQFYGWVITFLWKYMEQKHLIVSLTQYCNYKYYTGAMPNPVHWRNVIMHRSCIVKIVLLWLWRMLWSSCWAVLGGYHWTTDMDQYGSNLVQKYDSRVGFFFVILPLCTTVDFKSIHQSICDWTANFQLYLKGMNLSIALTLQGRQCFLDISKNNKQIFYCSFKYEV